MGSVMYDKSMSLDGFIAGANMRLEAGLGDDGERLHDWVEPSHYLLDEPVARADLARGDAFGPPPEIGVTQVTEHAFRHLSWLVKDDAVVGERLAGWVSFLDAYEPEPFRAFGPTG